MIATDELCRMLDERGRTEHDGVGSSKVRAGSSITDELREFASHCAGGMGGDALRHIADRIDAEHQKAMDEWKARDGQMWLKGYAECHAELLEGNETLASDLEGCGWIRLPKDADGEYIHVGDVVDVMPTDKFTGNRDVVVTSVIFKHSAALVTVDTADRPFTFWPNRIRHHHAPTVEDVLREFAEKMNENLGMYRGEAIDADEWREADAQTVEKYAAKLRLAEDSQTREGVLQSS